MATANPSLFGMLGDEAAMQRQLDEQRAKAFAEQTREQRLAQMGYEAGSQLGRGIAGAFGVEAIDPEVRQKVMLSRIASEIDPTDEQSIKEGIQKLRSAGFKDQADAVYKGYLENAKLKAEAVAKLREQDPALKLAATGNFTPASIAAFKKSQDYTDLVPKARNTQVVGIAKGTDAPVYEDDQGQFIYVQGADGKQTRAPYYGGVDRTTSKTSIDASTKGRTAFSEEISKLDAKRVDEAIKTRESAKATVASLDQLSKLDDQGLISGTYATGRVGATNLLSTLGLASPDDVKRLASSQNYQKVAGDVILGVLGGKLGTGFSNEDRKFIEGLVPQLETSPTARRQLIAFMRAKNMSIIDETIRMEEYARDNEGLKGFKPKLPMASQSTVIGMSVDDLAKAAGGKIVNGKFVPNK